MPPIQVIKRLYRNPNHPASFSGINKVGNHFNLSTRETRRILSGIRSYTTHRESKKPKYRNPFYVYNLRDQIQIDLIDIQQYSRTNRGVKYILTAIDLFSKFLVCIPMKSKTAVESEQAMIQMINEFSTRKRVKCIMSDAGTEFKNQRVKNMLEAQDFKHIIPDSDMKCPGIERVNKTFNQ